MSASADLRRLRLGPHLSVSFQRTTRLTSPLAQTPVSYGALPIWRTDAAARRDFAADALVPSDATEAFWIGFDPVDDRIASALRIGIKMAAAPALVDAITGETWTNGASETPRNYVVSPPRRSLYGVATRTGRVQQFVAAGTAEDDPEGIIRVHLICAPPRQVPVLPPRPGPRPFLHGGRATDQSGDAWSEEAGDAQAVQNIADDPYGITYWDFDAATTMTIGFVSPDVFSQRSGLPAPGPLDPASTYRGWRLP